MTDFRWAGKIPASTLYADNHIYLSGSMVDVEPIVENINAYLASKSNFSLRNGLGLNSQKSQDMAIFRKFSDWVVLSSVIINGASVPYSTRLNNLGMIMSCDLT
jgi:hypothetical protein